MFLDELRKYDNEVLKSRGIWFFAVPIAVLIITCVGIYYFQSTENQSNFKNYFIGIVINLVIWIFTTLVVTKPKLIKRNESKKNEIENIVEERFRKEIE